MAQSTLHFGFGMLCATAFSIKPVLSAWLQKNSMAGVIAKWCLTSYGLGLFAVFPAIFRRFTAMEPTHPLWNLFLGYPLISKLPLPSILLGELVIGSMFAIQYAIILMAIYRCSQNLSDSNNLNGQPINSKFP
jgi:hypothetical protein